MRAAEVTTETVEHFIADRLEMPSRVRPGETLTPATVNRATATLKAAFNHARKRGLLSRVPYVPKLREAEPRQGFLEPAEFARLVAHLPAHVADLARFAYITAWRKGEVTALRWDAVTWDAAHETPIEIRLGTSKSGRGRVLELDGELADIIARRWRARRVTGRDGQAYICPLVFHRDGERIQAFRKAWATACKAAGIPGRLFHDQRRSGIRNMVRAGVPERVAMDISGHRTRAVFDRYNISSAEDRREALKRVSRYVETEAGTPGLAPVAQLPAPGSRRKKSR